jgi:hypothetical protein
VATAAVIRNAAAELMAVAEALLDLECAALPQVVARAPEEDKRILQSFDLLQQRLRGLSAGLAALAAGLPESARTSLPAMQNALPLECQRAAILHGLAPAAPVRAAGSVEMF